MQLGESVHTKTAVSVKGTWFKSRVLAISSTPTIN